MKHTTSVENKAGTDGNKPYLNKQMLIFQSDLSSPRIFWAALTPLTHDLNRFGCEYQSYGTKRK